MLFDVSTQETAERICIRRKTFLISLVEELVCEGVGEGAHLTRSPSRFASSNIGYRYSDRQVRATRQTAIKRRDTDDPVGPL